MKEDKKNWINAALYVYMVVITIVISYFASNIWQKESWPNERFTIVVISSFAFIIVLLALCFKIKEMPRLMILYHALMISSLVFMLLPYEYRPFMLIFMLITYCIGLETGLVSALGVTVAVFFLCGSQQDNIYLYGTLIICACSCYTVSFVRNKIKFMVSCVVLIFVSFLVNGLFQYYYTESFDYKFAFSSLASVIIALIVFINIDYILKPKSVEPFVGEKSETVKAIKDFSLSMYYHCSEVAELAKAAAVSIDCDERLAYAGGMLHNIGKIYDSEDVVKASLNVANEYGMPKEIKAIMVECDAKRRFPASRESAIVMLAVSVISSIEYLKATNKEVSEKKIIDNVFNVRLSSGALDKSELSISELSKVKRAFHTYYGV